MRLRMRRSSSWSPISDRYGSPGLMNVSNCTRYVAGISPMDMVFECFLIVLFLSSGSSCSYPWVPVGP